MKVSELGEFGLIDLLAEMVAEAQDGQSVSWQRLVAGIGDDAAAWYGDDSIQLATTDCLVEGVHFPRGIFPWEELGWKALAVNLSDIAAMGGLPRYGLVSLALPADTEVDDVAALYRGMLALARRSGVAIVGGNVSRAPVVVIDVTVLGSAAGKNILTRAAARPGELVAVTGYPGTAAAGLKMLEGRLRLGAEATAHLERAFWHPEPRLGEGRLLLEAGVRAAIDVSDGLVADLGHICRASKVGARLEMERVPVHPFVREGFGDEAVRLALAGGEDYELLFTGSAEAIAGIKDKVSCPVTVIGEITTGDVGTVVVVDGRGNRLDAGAAGWEHFAAW